MISRYPAAALTSFAHALLVQAGLATDKARVVADILVEADLLGHTTHGLALLAPYLAELEKGAMRKDGEPRVVADFPAAVTWDGERLPGPWLTVKAFELAMQRARTQGTCTVAIARSHHIACLAAYLQRVAEAGFLGIVTCSAPGESLVAPHGGRAGVFTPNPIAAGWPTKGDPVILDVSMSISSFGKARRTMAEGQRFPADWVVDAQGRPSSDPAVLFGQPPGALLPIGGTDHGHKGYALALLVEALTSGLGGHGRADPSEGWSSSVMVQVFDPALFGGREAFARQTEWLARACRECPPRPGNERVRLPGETGLRCRERQLREGVELVPAIMPALEPWARKCQVRAPAALS